MNDMTELTDLLKHVSLFTELSHDELLKVARYTRERRLDKSELLFQRGDTAHGFFHVVSGQIKLAMSSAQGNEKIVDVIHPGQSFGEAIMFLDRNYPVFAEALTPCRLLHIGQSVVSELIDKDPGFARKLLAGMAIRLHGMVRDVETYSLRSSTQRVIGFLLQQAESPTGNAVQTVELPTSKQVIASRLNLTPETLSRIFHELSDARLIEVHGKQVTLLDLKRLAAHQS